jgi:hypothetical protein
MYFTIENQLENNISRTTSQTVKHNLYGNNEVSISGLDGSHHVWHKFGHRMQVVAEGLSLVEAVEFSNKFIMSI